MFERDPGGTFRDPRRLEMLGWVVRLGVRLTIDKIGKGILGINGDDLPISLAALNESVSI
jgi:hypothetical protein